MHPGRSGRSLGERAANSGVGSGLDAGFGDRADAGPVAGPRPEPSGTDPAEGRHCWVHDPPGAPGTWPGLLVEWRRHGGAWQGRVAYTVAGRHGSVLVEAWLPAEQLRSR